MSLRELSDGFWYNNDNIIYKVPEDTSSESIDAEISNPTTAKFVKEVETTIIEYTEDNIVGRSTCDNCGNVVLRRDRYCWFCGAKFINSTYYFWRNQWR